MERFMYAKRLTLALAAACIGAAAVPVAASAVADPMARPALMVAQPAKAYLTGIARAGKRLVAVGERGIIVLSDDDGATWRQAGVPVSVTLAAVQFPTPTQGWAVGHYGVVLHTSDGGATWTRQLDGVQAAQLVLRDAQAGQGGAAYLAEAQRLVADGPDKPFLGLHFTDANNGFIVGAYNLAFRTRDGGKTWAPFGNRLDNPKASHLYVIEVSGSDVLVAGEQGVLLRSTDNGTTFARVALPYKGSFFALASSGADAVVAGLGGNAFVSHDRGATWTPLALPAPVSVTAARLEGGRLLMANQAGTLLAGAAGATAIAPLNMPALPQPNDVIALPGGAIVTVGVTGAVRLPAQAATSTSMAAR
jgi:photosystem II stability/assembly factor-like uncharacterized protein